MALACSQTTYWATRGILQDTQKLTWVFHLVMIQEAQGLQGIALGVPLQQPRGAALA